MHNVVNHNLRLWLRFGSALVAAVACIAAFPERPANAASHLQINNLSSELELQVRRAINLPRSEAKLAQPGVLKEIAEAAVYSLEAIGYYNASASAQLVKNSTTPLNEGGPTATQPTTVVKLDVQPGVATRVQSLTIDVQGDPEAKQAMQPLMAALPIKQGEVFNHAGYEQTKDELFNLAHNNGYFEARFTRNQVLVDNKKASASIDLALSTGPRYRFGAIKINANRLDQFRLQRWVPFPPGAFYDSTLLHSLTENLQNSGYFNQVTVKPNLTDAGDGIVPIEVELVPAPRNAVNLGAGFATDSGLRFQWNWLRPYHNNKGDSLETRSSASEQRQQLSINWRRPYQFQPATDRLSINAGLLNYRTQDTFSRQRTLELVDHRLNKRGWFRDLILRWEYEKFKVSDNGLSTTLLLPGIGFSKTSASHKVYPRFGYNLQARVLFASREFWSDLNLFKISASAKMLNTWNERHRIIATVKLGAIDTSDFLRLPITHRFFTGGHGSVRGYPYQSLSPTNDEGNLIGGRYLTTASLEYEFHFLDKWAVATFIDTGRAYLDAGEDLRTAVGIGLRWSSPVGPIRLDLAKPLESESNSVRLHVAIGPHF